MLKKADLAKQFELVIKQEIKNYQDSLNFVLQSINELKESIERVQNENLTKNAEIKNNQNNLSIYVYQLKDSLNLIQSKLDSSLNDQRVVNERNQTQILDLTEAVLKKINVDVNVEAKIKNLWNEIAKLQSTSDLNYSNLNQTADELLKRFANAISKTKLEIMDAPTNASLVKTELEEKISGHKVDVAGIMRELSIYKKENYITEKKIENIYTLIERLKKPEVTP